MLKKLSTTIATFILICLIGVFNISSALSLEQELEQVQEQLEQIRNEKAALESEISQQQYLQGSYEQKLNGLKNTIDLLGKKIGEKELVIKELRLEIHLFNKKILKTEKEIAEIKNNIKDLQIETDQRLIDMYLTQKTFSDLDIFFEANAGSDIVKLNLYQTSIQDETNGLVDKLRSQKKQIEEKQIELTEARIEVQRDEVQLNEELVNLEKSQTELDVQRGIYYGLKQESSEIIKENKEQIVVLTDEEKSAIEEQERIQALILSRNEVVNGLPIAKGTFLGVEGQTGYAYGAHLHFAVYEGGFLNPCNYIPAGVYSGCGGSGIFGIPLAPSGQLTSGYGPRWGTFHSAIDISTGGGASVMAAHKGYAYFGFEPCPAYAGICNGGGAIYAKVCEVNGCTSGKRTLYYHLACTAEPSSSPRSCN